MTANKYNFLGDEVVQEISLLYELALSIGHSLDLKRNCEKFLTILQSRKRIEVASVWLRNAFLHYEREEGFSQVFAFPSLSQTLTRLPDNHLILQKLAERKHVFITDAQPEFSELITEKEVKKGAYAVYQLADIGFLKLYSSRGLDALNPLEINKLQKVIDKFAIALKACLYYEKSALATARLSTLIENLQSGVLLEDEHRRVSLVNPLFCELFQIPLPPQALIGLACEGALEQSKHLFADEEGFVKRIEELLAHKKLVLGEELHLKDGRIFSRNYVPIWLNDLYLGHLWKYSDITSQKRNLQIIQENEAKLRVVIDSALDAVVLINEKGQVLEWNGQAENIFGWSKAEALGQLLDVMIIPEEYREAHHRGMAHFLATGHGPVLNQRLELPALRKNGEAFLIELSITPVQIEGQYYFSAFARDITARKQAEQELIQAKQKAEEAAQAKQQFLSTMSHEIRTPMNAIIGMSRLLEKTPLEPKQQEYLRAIKTSGDNLLVIINDILDVTKIEAGKLELDKVGFRLKEVFENLKHTTFFKAEEKGLALEFFIDPDLAEIFIGDPVRLFQVLLNLTNNAIKFTQKGFVRVESHLLSTTPLLNVVEFKVRDSGKGILPDKIPIIFESFTQEDATIQKEYGGTGLGLAITKKLVELFGGKIRVHSQPGLGSEFSFALVFPRGNAADLPPSQEIQPEENALLGRRILVVEDNEINQFYARTILHEWGVEVDIAEDGQKGVEMAQSQKYDLILMDIQLPLMNGVEATRLIRQRLASKIPILALTANAIKTDIETYLQAGMDDFVAKPFVPGELFRKLIQYLPMAPPQMDSEGRAPELSSPFAQTWGRTSVGPLYSLRKLEEAFKNDARMVQKMVQLFLEKTPLGLEEMEMYFHQQNWAQLARVAHKLKSSLELMDMPSIMEAMNLLKNSPQNPDPVELQRALRQVQSVCQQVFEELRPQVGNTPT